MYPKSHWNNILLDYTVYSMVITKRRQLCSFCGIVRYIKRNQQISTLHEKAKVLCFREITVVG